MIMVAIRAKVHLIYVDNTCFHRPQHCFRTMRLARLNGSSYCHHFPQTIQGYVNVSRVSGGGVDECGILCSRGVQGIAGHSGILTDASPFLAAIMDPIMSGTDVPTASTNTPITIALTPRMQAAPVASAT